MHIRVYSDPSFGTNDALSSQMGYIILLSDNCRNIHVLEYCSEKSKRVVRSTMAAEVYALVEAFDAAYVFANDLQTIQNTVVLIDLFTDSKQVFDAVTKVRETAEERLIIDVLATKKAYRRFEIRSIGLVSSKSNPSDGLSKLRNSGVLRRLLSRNVDETQVQQ